MKEFLQSLRTGSFFKSQELCIPTTRATFTKLLVLTSLLSHCFKYWELEVQQLLKREPLRSKKALPSEALVSLQSDPTVSRLGQTEMGMLTLTLEYLYGAQPPRLGAALALAVQLFGFYADDVQNYKRE